MENIIGFENIISIDRIKPWIIALLTIFIGWLLIKLLGKITVKMLRKTSLDPVLYKFINHGIQVVCLAVLVGTSLSYVGVPLSTFVTVLGVAGAAIALSLRDSLSNIAGGFIIMASKPFKKGDLIEVGSTLGIVEQIDLLFTKLLTPDNRVVHIPNGNLSTSTIINFSAEENRRVDCRFGISGSSSIYKAKEVLAVVAEQSDIIFNEPEPVIGVVEQVNGIVFLEMRVWCRTENVLAVRFFLEENVKIAFDEVGIEMPVPYVNIQSR